MRGVPTDMNRIAMCLAEMQNPYLPPSSSPSGLVRISGIGRLLLSLPLIPTLKFVDQDVSLSRGFAFWVNRSRLSILFAPCPFFDSSDEQRCRMVASIFRDVNDRLEARPCLSRWLFARILVVRWVDLNGDVRFRFAREANIDWSKVAQATADG